MPERGFVPDSARNFSSHHQDLPDEYRNEYDLPPEGPVARKTNPVDDGKKTMSRRGALKALMGIGAAAAGLEAARTVNPARLARGLDKASEFLGEISLKQDIAKLRSTTENLKKEFKITAYEDLPPEDLPALRAEFKKKHGAEVKRILVGLDRIIGSEKKGKITLSEAYNALIQDLFAVVRDFSFHGTVYNFLGQHNLLTQESKYTYGIGQYMKARVEDFLPKPEQLTAFDLDPMLPFDDKKDQQTLWKSEAHLGYARELLKQTEIRAFFNSHGLLQMSAVFSFLKALTRYRLWEKESPGVRKKKQLTDVEVLKRLWKERMDFWDEIIIDQETQVIECIGDEDRFSETTKGFGKVVRQFTKKIDRHDIKADKAAKEKFLDAIKKSSGKTALVIQTHGLPNGIYIENKNVITPDEFAAALWERIKNYRDRSPKRINQALKELKIIQYTCFPYDFYLKMTARLEELCHENKVNYDKLEPLRLIAAAEEGSVLRSNYTGEEFDKYGKVLAGRKDFRGRDMLLPEPDSYTMNGDMTISTIKKGANYSISELFDRQSPGPSPESDTMV